MSKKWVCLVTAFLVLGPVWAVKATVTPVGWWKLDETSGTTAVDSSGNKYHGTLVNGRRINRQPLSDGDVIRIGHSVLVYRQDGGR